MTKIYFTATARRGVPTDRARDDALEALSRSHLIERVEASVGLFGRLTRRDYAKERDT